MSIDRFRELAAGYVDDELTADERREFEKLMAEHPELREDVNAFQKISDLTKSVRFEEAPDPIWEAYDQSSYRRAESKFGWLLFLFGAIIILGFFTWQITTNFFLDSSAPILIRIGVGTLYGGLIVLLVSKLRQTLFARKRERYAKVQK